MFWDNDDDSEDMQRFKNLIFLRVPFTNKTRDEALPGMVILVFVLVFAGGIYEIFFK
jgi:hypothetical protein